MNNATLVINKMSFKLTCTSCPRCDSVQEGTIGQALDNMKQFSASDKDKSGEAIDSEHTDADRIENSENRKR